MHTQSAKLVIINLNLNCVIVVTSKMLFSLPKFCKKIEFSFIKILLRLFLIRLNIVVFALKFAFLIQIMSCLKMI